MIETVDDAKQYLRDNILDGVNCPACDQYVHISQVTIGAEEAKWLIKLVQIYERTGSWVDINDMNKVAIQRNGNYAKLRHRGLIEKYEWNEDHSKSSAGLWRPTGLGVRFAKGQTSVPKYVYLYNRKPVAVGGSHLGGDPVMIEDCLKKKFDFQSLWLGFEEPEPAKQEQTSLI